MDVELFSMEKGTGVLIFDVAPGHVLTLLQGQCGPLLLHRLACLPGGHFGPVSAIFWPILAYSQPILAYKCV